MKWFKRIAQGRELSALGGSFDGFGKLRRSKIFIDTKTKIATSSVGAASNHRHIPQIPIRIALAEPGQAGPDSTTAGARFDVAPTKLTAICTTGAIDI